MSANLIILTVTYVQQTGTYSYNFYPDTYQVDNEGNFHLLIQDGYGQQGRYVYEPNSFKTSDPNITGPSTTEGQTCLTMTDCDKQAGIYKYQLTVLDTTQGSIKIHCDPDTEDKPGHDHSI